MMRETLFAQERMSETQFSTLVDELKNDPARRARLAEFLREDNPVYRQRGSNATIRMRGWVLLAFVPLGLPESALLYVLEELDNGRDAYLVAAAAHALRSYPNPTSDLAPYLMRAIDNIRFHDDTVCLDCYGGYAVVEGGTTATQELLATLSWLGNHACGVVPELAALRANKGGEFSAALVAHIERTIDAIQYATALREPVEASCCCAPPAELSHLHTWAPASREGADPIDAAVFEDQDGKRIHFADFFRGQPSVVAFFYTRCNNPRKCSLTIEKLARVQHLLEGRGLEDRIRTAAISYDPAFDLPERLRGYGLSRGLTMGDGHRMLRATEGMSSLCEHFRLGVNFVESLVNRHRIEVYVLDAAGRIAASFERLQWDEREVVDQVAVLIDDGVGETGARTL